MNLHRIRHQPLFLFLIASSVFCVWPQPVRAVEEHLEDMKLAVIETRISCATCHPDAEHAKLTTYGQRISDLGTSLSVQQRVKAMERRPSEVNLRENPEKEKARIDVDGDGTLNWVEILCGSDPSDPDSTPHSLRNPDGATSDHHISPGSDSTATTAARASGANAGGKDRADTKKPKPTDDEASIEIQLPDPEVVERIINCGLCHTSNHVEPVGDDKGPHNKLGDALEKLAERGRKPGESPDDHPPIMGRFKRQRMRDTDRDKARNWIEIITFHSPTDANDKPSEAEESAMKTHLREIRRGKAGFGREHREKKRH